VTPSEIEKLRKLDCEVVWHPFSQMAEYNGLIIESADGCWLTAVDGKRYLDGASSLWCNIHGHRHPKIDKAIIDQLRRVAHVTNLGMSHPTTIELAKRLVDLSPDGLNHVFFSSDGASSVEVAMKMAFQYWRQCEQPEPQRNVFLALGDAYHGDTIGTTSVGGVSRFRDLFEPLLFPVLRGPCPKRESQSLTDENTAAKYLASYERILQERGDRIAAILVEPLVQAAAGIVIHARGFLKGLSELSKKYKTLLIADEVAVGFGRTGKMFACEHEEVTPDLMCLGKGLTGGYLPMSATLCTTKIWDAFLGDSQAGKAFLYGHTFTGNALAAAAANASLDIFESEQTLQQLEHKAKLLLDRLQPLSQYDHVGQVRQLGLITAIDFVADKATQKPFPSNQPFAAKVCSEALKHQVWLRPLAETLPIIPPLSITDSEIEHLAQAIMASIETVSRGLSFA
jgi:adenosylmethionine---8-amino-7-oxononanoate aminotransferase